MSLSFSPATQSATGLRVNILQILPYLSCQKEIIFLGVDWDPCGQSISLHSKKNLEPCLVNVIIRGFPPLQGCKIIPEP